MENNKFINMQLKSFEDKEDGSREYKAIVYTNDVDRDGEKATHEFLEEMTQLIIDKPITKNHDWNDVDNIVGRVIEAVIVSDNECEAVEATFVVKDSVAIEKIEKELYKGLSVGFQTEKEKGDDGVILLTHCTDVYEVSFVTVPAVPRASIKIKLLNLGGNKAMIKGFRTKKLLAKYPTLKSVEPEALEELTKDSNVEVTDADIEELLEENESLRNQIKDLAEKLSAYAEAEAKAEAESYVLSETEKAVDELEPTEEAKEVIMDEAKEALECGDLVVEYLPDTEGEKCVKGLDSFIDKVKTRYTKLKMLGVKKEEPTENTEEVPVEDLVQGNKEVKAVKAFNDIKFSNVGSVVDKKSTTKNNPSNNVNFE